MQKAALISRFSLFVPPHFAAYCASLLIEHSVLLRITSNRKTKSGDHRAPQRGNPQHRVSVNGDLGPYSFLLVYIHEMAHVVTWKQYGFKVMPHGKEWKHHFKLLAQPILQSQELPPELRNALHRFFIKTPATFLADPNLYSVLERIENPENQALLLRELLPGAHFVLENGKAFQVIKKLRTWFLCIEEGTGKTYKVSGSARVFLIEHKA